MWKMLFSRSEWPSNHIFLFIDSHATQSASFFYRVAIDWCFVRARSDETPSAGKLKSSSRKSKVHRHSASFSVKKPHPDLSQRKSIKVHRRRAQQVNEMKEKKEMFVFFLTLERRRRFEFYMHPKHKLSCTSLYYISNACLCFHLRPASTFQWSFFLYFIVPFLLLSAPHSAHNFYAKIYEKKCVSPSLSARTHQVCPNFLTKFYRVHKKNSSAGSKKK